MANIGLLGFALCLLIGAGLPLGARAGDYMINGKAGAQLHRYFNTCAKARKECSGGNCRFEAEALKCRTIADEGARGTTCEFRCNGEDLKVDGAAALHLVERLEISHGEIFEHGAGQAFFMDGVLKCEKPESLQVGSCTFSHPRLRLTGPVPVPDRNPRRKLPETGR